jgi:hypothetical protein
VCYFWNNRVIRVCISHQWNNWKEHLGDSERNYPIVMENIQGKCTVVIDIRMVDSGKKSAFRWLEWIVSWERNVQIEDTSSIWGIIGSRYLCLPVIIVTLVSWPSLTVGGGIFFQVNKFLSDSSQSHLWVSYELLFLLFYLICLFL